MNKITIRKGILKNIQYSHTIKDVEYNKADLIVKRKDGKEDLINIRFKKFSNNYKENDEIDLTGNIRSYSQHLDSGKNSVELYVFTYFDQPEDVVEDENTPTNLVEIDGRICKKDELRKTQSGKHNLHFVIANNIITNDKSQKLNSYLPTIAWGKIAREMSKLPISTKVKIVGELHSREYKKELGNGDIEIRVARELVVNSYEVVEEDKVEEIPAESIEA